MLAVTSPLLQRPGAVEADPPDAGVAAHYGEPFREQRALASGSAGVDLSHRPVVRVTGPDRLAWLHSLTSQHLEQLPPGEATEALVLSPHGHVEHALYLVDDGETTWAHVEPGTAGDLVRWLDSMRFWSKVEVVDESESYAVVLTPAGVEAVPSRRTPEGVESFVPRADLVSVLDGPLAGVSALEALRIADGRPRLGLETDHRTIPHELGWLTSAVHLDKGCYRGQETVARVHNLGRPPRRLVLLHLSGERDELPAPGAPLLLDGRTVGFLGTAVQHHELGPVALGVVKRTVADGTVLDAAGIPAAVDGGD